MRSPTLRLDADRVQRRVGARVPRVAADDARDLVAAVRRRRARSRRAAEVAERDLRRAAMVAADLVGVRGAELALHFPDQVGQLGARGHALEQRLVAAQHRLPVDAGHVGDPEVVALQPPHFAQHLRPLGARLDRERGCASRSIQPLLRDGASDASSASPSSGLRFGGDRAQPLAVAHQQRRVIGGERRSRRPCRSASRLRASRSRTPRAGRRRPCGRRGRARRRSAAPSTRTLPSQRRRRSGRSGSRRTGNGATRARDAVEVDAQRVAGRLRRFARLRRACRRRRRRASGPSAARSNGGWPPACSAIR